MYIAENARFAEQINVPKGAFSGAVVALELPSDASTQPDAAIAFMMAANLLCRIFTKLYLIAPDIPIGSNAWQIKTLSELVAPLSEISEGDVTWGSPSNSDIAIGVGSNPSIAAKHRTFFSFSGWDAALEIELLKSWSGPLGALFAACYGVAQAFIFAAQMAGAELRPIRPFRLSLLNYEHAGPPSPRLPHINIPNVHLVGVGAVGSALIYSLAHFPSVTGLLSVIDNDWVDMTNLNRYVLMCKADAVPEDASASKGRAKVEVAVNALSHQQIVVHPFAMKFEEFRRIHQKPIELLLTPVDSEPGRRKLAAHLPRMVLNAATGHSTVTISRHHFNDGKACLHCLYMPPVGENTVEGRLANDLGLSLAEVEQYLADNSGVDADLVRRIEIHRSLPEGSLQPFIGQHLQSFYQRAVCGEAAIKTAAGTIVSPLSFISAAAGVMLAAELIKVCTAESRQFALDNYFRIDTLANPNPAFKSVRMQEPTRRCICWDEDYRSVYRSRFPCKAN